MHIHGIIPPVATPMKDNEDLDLPRLKWFLDRLIGNGVHGVCPRHQQRILWQIDFVSEK
jgi:dihydrodipicolinate synthase/N-acetylneuraminate lyase